MRVDQSKNENLLPVLWDAELDILNAFDLFCRKYDLKYSLAYGSLLGAVRHGGFIPWDDDIDVIMPRKDYEILVKTWNQSGPKGYILQNKDTNWDFNQNFSKIRKENTTFIQYEFEKNVTYHTGIFIDIFPGDRAAAGVVGRRIQMAAAAVNLLISRGFTSESVGFSQWIEKAVLALPLKLKKILFKISSGIIQKWNKNEELDFYFPNTLEWARNCYPCSMFEELKEISFEDHLYLCVNDPDTILTIDYGDYMRFPPPEERVWRHHPIILDAEKAYIIDNN